MVTVLMAGLIHGVFFFWESFIKALCSGEEWCLLRVPVLDRPRK
jgi:hypothetical protein